MDTRHLLRAALVLLATSACAKSPSTPSPTSAASPAPTPAAPIVLTGHVTATVTGEALGGLTLDLSGRPATTDANGAFRYDLPATTAGSAAVLNLTAPGIVPRSLLLSLSGSRDISADAISLANAGFSLDFYRRLVRDNYDSPGVLRTLRRWMTAPRLYVRTIDDAGQAIDSLTLDTVIGAFGDDASALTGGRFGLAGIDRGTETREGVPGWITVKWTTSSPTSICGRAQIAVDGGWIELSASNALCACKGSRMFPGAARHELGHALGFWHTGDAGDLMSGKPQACDEHATARERYHAAIAYSRLVGNLDPDTDPSSVFQSSQTPVVVVN